MINQTVSKFILIVNSLSVTRKNLFGLFVIPTFNHRAFEEKRSNEVNQELIDIFLFNNQIMANDSNQLVRILIFVFTKIY